MEDGFGALVVLGGREVVDAREAVGGRVEDVVGAADVGCAVVLCRMVGLVLVVGAVVVVVTGLPVLVVDAATLAAFLLVVDFVVPGCGLLDAALDEESVVVSGGTVTAAPVVVCCPDVVVLVLMDGELALTVSPDTGATLQAVTPTSRHAVRAASARRMGPTVVVPPRTVAMPARIRASCGVTTGEFCGDGRFPTRDVAGGLGSEAGYRPWVPAADLPSLDDLPGVAEAVGEARAAVDAVYRHPANRRGWPTSAAAAALRAARASAVLDGGRAALDPEAAAVTDPVLAGAIRAVREVPALATVAERSPLQALARLHTLAAADLVGADELGRPQARPGIAERLTGLAQVISAPPWSGPVLVAVVHGELLALRPFGTADGVVARAAARLVMLTSGLDRRGLTVPEVGHLRSGAQYSAGVRAYAQGDPDGVAAWIVQVCAALQVGAREGLSVAEANAEGGPAAGF